MGMKMLKKTWWIRKEKTLNPNTVIKKEKNTGNQENGIINGTTLKTVVQDSKPYDEDTDEEVERKFDSDDEAYNADTDIDDCEVETYRPKTDGIKMPVLSRYFKS